MRNVHRFLSFVDRHALKFLTFFLLVFIPLFPKIPVLDIVPGYIVRVRPEDFLVVLTALVFIKEVLQKRITLHSSYFWFVCAYAISGIISLVLAVFLIQTIPLQLLHVGKSALHFFRYLEYFALFFFAYHSITTHRHRLFFIAALAGIVITASLYGLGQQHLEFPVYSTMNREYSKGQTLYLQEGVRPQSTFAGHYDLGAFLAIALPLLLANILWRAYTKEYYKIPLSATALLLGSYMLFLSGAKTAWAAAGLGLAISAMLFFYQTGNLKKLLLYGLASGFTLMCLATAIWILQPSYRQEQLLEKANSQEQVKLLLVGLGITENTNEDQEKPADLTTGDHEYALIATTSATGETTYLKIPSKSTWSENALKYGISMGIRLDTLWPQALKGFFTNPLFGSGYATLSKTESGQFTEADSTDNNFLRTLGETGILGFCIFYGLVIGVMVESYKTTTKKQQSTITLENALAAGMVGSSIAMLLNAVYIDVFAASKVAFSFWGFAGVILAQRKISPTWSLEKSMRHLKNNGGLYLVLALSIFILHQNPIMEQSQLRNLPASENQLLSLVQAKCFWQPNASKLCETIDTQLQPYSVLLLPFWKLYSKPEVFFYANLTFILAILTVTYLLIRQYGKLGRAHSAILMTLLPVTIFVTQISKTPLTTSTLLLLAIFPLLALMLSLVMQKMPKKALLVLSGLICTFSLIILGAAHAPQKITQAFKDTTEPLTFRALQRANLFFEKKNAAEPTDAHYIITTLNPYYVDLYAYTTINPIPFKTEFLAERLQNGESIFLSDYGTQNNNELQKIFSNIRQQFTVRYEVIDCLEQCNLYKVSKKEKRTSTMPQGITGQKLEPESLDETYQFIVIPNSFEEIGTTEQPQTYTTKEFANTVKDILTAEKNSNFAIISGDYLHKQEQNWRSLFTTIVAQTRSIPILFTQGNRALKQVAQPPQTYASFFTKKEYFIFLDTNSSGELDTDQKLFFYNALLELEELPQIETLFIIAPDLTATNQIEQKISSFSSLKTHIIINQNDSEELSTMQKQTGNIQYHTIQLGLHPEQRSFLKVTVSPKNILLEKVPSYGN